MPRTTSPSLPLSVSTSRPPGPHSTLTSSCMSSCSQVTPSVPSRHVPPSPSLPPSPPPSLLPTVGLYFCFTKLTDQNIFIILYGVTSIYFAVSCHSSRVKGRSKLRPPQGVMVRLMLVLAPVMCVLSGIAVSSILSTYMKNLELFEVCHILNIGPS